VFPAKQPAGGVTLPIGVVVLTNAGGGGPDNGDGSAASQIANAVLQGIIGALLR
jgi:hypothetical protein